MKKFFALALCAAMMLTLVACGSDSEKKSDQSGAAAQTEDKDKSTSGSGSESITPAGTTEQVNPYVDCQTLEKAQKLAGISWTVPEEIGGSNKRLFRAVKDELLEVVYQSEEGETARIRKAVGSEDCSGVNEKFAVTETADVGGQEITMKGDGQAYTVALWHDETNAYSVVLKNGMSREDLSSLIVFLQSDKTV